MEKVDKSDYINSKHFCSQNTIKRVKVTSNIKRVKVTSNMGKYI